MGMRSLDLSAAQDGILLPSPDLPMFYELTGNVYRLERVAVATVR